VVGISAAVSDVAKVAESEEEAVERARRLVVALREIH
jgi:hypothetical protein